MYDYIKDLTDKNLHTEALIESAKLLEHGRLREEILLDLHAIEREHMALGHITKELMDRRQKNYELLKAVFEKTMRWDEFDAWYGAL